MHPRPAGPASSRASAAWPRLAAAVVVLVCAVIGLLAADQTNRALRIDYEERALPQDGPVDFSARPVPEPVRPVDRILLPTVPAEATALYDAAAERLVEALALRSGRAPVIEREGPGARRGGTVTLLVAEPGVPPGSFRVRAHDGGITIQAGSPLAGAHGLSFLTERLLAGITQAELSALDRVVAPILEDRFVDLGGVGILPDSAAWAARDYSHHARAFQHVLAAEAPYVDSVGFAEVREQFRAYVLRMAAYGYNGIIFKGLLEFIDFDRLEDGFAVYPADSPYRERHRAMRAAFGELFEYAHGLGMKVVLSTDMVALTPPLERYLRQRFARIDAEDAALWEVYRVGLAELFETMPAVQGVMVRVGETGAVFNLPNWDYTSELYVRSIPALHAMLSAFDAAARDADRTVYFRTWSVGIGETGGMHTRPEVYANIFDALRLPNVVVSTKYVAGDFYSYLPLNETLALGDERRMVEFQARREFDGFAAFPNFVSPLHQVALQELRAANRHVRGIWVWTQEGGPTRVSPRSLYPFHGFWQLIDADVFVTGRLAWDPNADVTALTRAWVRSTFGMDSTAVENLTELLLTSRGAVLDGLYIEPYARRQVRALGLEPPPMLWIFEWDIVTGSSAALSTIYRLSSDHVAAAVTQGYGAVDAVRRMRARVDAIDPDRVTRPDLLERVRQSLAFQEDLLLTLALYRESFLLHYRWLDTGDRDSRNAWRTATADYRAQRDAHVARYGGDLDFRAYSFFDADAGIRHAERDLPMAWLARALLLLIAGAMVARVISPGLPRGILASATLLLVLGAVLVFSWFDSPSMIAACALTLGGFLAVLLIQVPRHGRAEVWGAATMALLLPSTAALVPVAVRGPGYFWFQFWTSGTFRVLLVTLLFATAGWLVVSTLTALRTARSRMPAALGLLMVAFGAPLLTLAAALQLMGLERALTMLNNELAVLPMGLSVILGITTHLNIPLALPWYLALCGSALVLAGAALRLLPDRTRTRGRGAPVRIEGLGRLGTSGTGPEPLHPNVPPISSSAP